MFLTIFLLSWFWSSSKCSLFPKAFCDALLANFPTAHWIWIKYCKLDKKYWKRGGRDLWGNLDFVHQKMFLHWQVLKGCSRKEIMGVFDGTFILPPSPNRFNYCLCPPPIRSNCLSTPQPTLLFFLVSPSQRIGTIFFSFFSVFKPKQHKDPIWQKIPTELHFWEGQPPTELHFHKRQPPTWLENKYPHNPYKNIVLCL